MWVTAFAVGLTLVAAITDLWRQRIYNGITYPGMLLAMVLHVWDAGLVGLEHSLLGWGLCGGIMLFCFAFFPQLGGGDVKLLAMLGAFLGPQQGLEVMLWSFVLGAGAAVVTLIWRVGFLKLVREVGHYLWLVLRTGQMLPLTESQRAPLRPYLHLAPMSLLAVILVRWRLVP